MTPYVDIHTHRPTGRHIEPTSAGLHPWDAGKGDAAQAVALFGKVQAAGEIGLDFACGVPRRMQEEALRVQLRAAEEIGKPVVLHCVRAFEPLMKILDGYALRAVIFHGFIGSVQQARQAVGKGYYLSFGDRSLRSPKTVQALREVPPENIFLETDEGEPAIEDIYARAADVRGIEVDELKEAILANYERIFEHDEQQLVRAHRTAFGQ